MSVPGLGDGVVGGLQRALGRLSTRASVLASNLANADTPGYRALRASFPAEVDQAQRLQMLRTDRSHYPPPLENTRPEPALHEAAVTRIRMDGNTVDLDREMTELTSVKGRFSAAASMMRRRFGLLLYTVTDGKR